MSDFREKTFRLLLERDHDSPPVFLAHEAQRTAEACCEAWGHGDERVGVCRRCGAVVPKVQP